MDRSASLLLNNSVIFPRLGIGTWNLRGGEAASAIKDAIEIGYRSVDTAAQYANEEAVGLGIERSGIPRDEIFVTTKLPNNAHAYEDALRSFDASCKRLRLERIDLYLIHWPVPKRDMFLDAWRALEKLYTDGRVRSIGVSNFTVNNLTKLMSRAAIFPAVNQIELHPKFSQAGMRDFHVSHGIITEAWSPLAKGGVLLHDPKIVKVARIHGKTAAQVVLRWHLQIGNSVIPKSAKLNHLRENFNVFDFELSDVDMATMCTLESGLRIGEDPEEVT